MSAAAAAIFDDNARNAIVSAVRPRGAREPDCAEVRRIGREIEEIEFLVSFRRLQNRSRIPAAG